MKLNTFLIGLVTLSFFCCNRKECDFREEPFVYITFYHEEPCLNYSGDSVVCYYPTPVIYTSVTADNVTEGSNYEITLENNTYKLPLNMNENYVQYYLNDDVLEEYDTIRIEYRRNTFFDNNPVKCEGVMEISDLVFISSFDSVTNEGRGVLEYENSRTYTTIDNFEIFIQ